MKSMRKLRVHTLDDCHDDKFDWKLIGMEELIDLVQYRQKEIIRLERLLNPRKQYLVMRCVKFAYFEWGQILSKLIFGTNELIHYSGRV